MESECVVVCCAMCVGWGWCKRDGRGEQQACEEGGEAERGGQRGIGGGAWGARNLGGRAAVRALEGDAPLFVAVDFFTVLC